MACFADINVSQGSVATYARCGGMFSIRLTSNLLRYFRVKIFYKSVKIWRNYGYVARFSAHPVDAAYCYRRSVVCLSVDHNRECYKYGWTVRSAVCGMDSGGTVCQVGTGSSRHLGGGVDISRPLYSMWNAACWVGGSGDVAFHVSTLAAYYVCSASRDPLSPRVRSRDTS